MYSDAAVVALYDLQNPWDGGLFAADAFYRDATLPAALAMSATGRNALL